MTTYLVGACSRGRSCEGGGAAPECTQRLHRLIHVSKKVSQGLAAPPTQRFHGSGGFMGLRRPPAGNDRASPRGPPRRQPETDPANCSGWQLSPGTCARCFPDPPLAAVPKSLPSCAAKLALGHTLNRSQARAGSAGCLGRQVRYKCEDLIGGGAAAGTAS